MPIAGRLKAQALENSDLRSGGRPEIEAAHNISDAESPLIDRGRQVIGQEAIRPAQDHVAHLLRAV